MFEAISSFLFGNSSSSIVGKAADIASEYIEDADKKNELIAELVRSYQQSASTTTVPWADAVHKLGRQGMQFLLIGFYIYAWRIGQPVPIEDMALLAAGPGLYTLLKGKGR